MTVYSLSIAFNYNFEFYIAEYYNTANRYFAFAFYFLISIEIITVFDSIAKKRYNE